MAKTKPKVKQSEFFTRQKANEGIELPLSTPDGRETSHWIRIRGVDSDAFRKAEAESRRRVFQLATEKADTAAVEKAGAEEETALLAALVISWSFDDPPFTLENVKKFLTEAPQIAQQINKLSARRALFFANSLKPSTPSQEPTSS